MDLSGQPHTALFLVVPRLGLRELLSVAQVCVSLRDAVDKDVLPWLDIMVGDILCRRLSGEMLLKLTAKAEGKVRSLGLSNCIKISEEALLAVVIGNPNIETLNLTGCTGLTPEGVIKVAEALSKQGSGLRCLKIDGIYDLHEGHLQTLKSLVRQEGKGNQGIDVDVCPRCHAVRKVFSCRRETCKRKGENRGKECIGCAFCIPRCVECGGCVETEEADEAEAACPDVLCLGCWSKLTKCIFCNRPYCWRHSEQQQCYSPLLRGQSGFVCEFCDSSFHDEDDDFV
ncbi:hypothetical protein MLD38_005424 [Melastoma candidum]|uniref:Uncharacterized protein n=1 Tax=Melastoma candidum TaxID=119954 RepID=A0ACB9RK55_9MYRT|nr:hypothetical protein MLD38_005424 [Melastoma candidum]